MPRVTARFAASSVFPETSPALGVAMQPLPHRRRNGGPLAHGEGLANLVFIAFGDQVSWFSALTSLFTEASHLAMAMPSPDRRPCLRLR